MKFNLPNVLTILRLVAAPTLVLVYLVLPRPWADWTALVLFVSAAMTDYLDGLLARRWMQVTAFGKMLDPIADKAMTIIALVMLTVLLLRDGRVITYPYPPQNYVAFGDWILIVPVMMVIFREIFVSGLREFIGKESKNLAVTRLAKWKTAAQMSAVIVLFSFLLFEHYFGVLSFAMEREFVAEVIAGREEDLFGLRWKYTGWVYSYNLGMALLWMAGVLTLVTGIDYFRKALPFIRDGEAK